MPCRCNTFDRRLLWFDGVEGKLGLTLTVFLLLLLLFVCVCVGGGGGAGGGVKLFDCIVRTGVHGILCA